MFKKVLIANRGEIAVRIIRACREMGIRTVVVFSEVDRKALHVRYADEAYPVGGALSSESYLRIDHILDAAKQSGAQAIHPGYGFLSENPEFAAACNDAGLVFIGPTPAAMKLMGSKTASRRALMAAGLPVVPGTDRDIESFDEIRRLAEQIGYPLMVKASAGGGGKGMRRVDSPGDLESAYRTARSEAQNAFNDPSLYCEKLIERPRHIEIQILGDQHGNLLHLGERECSLQRRHQKVMEECPSFFLDDDLRRRMGETALRIGRLAGYTSAGTVEFLMDQNHQFYFLEMNARLQVEHPVTEMVTGLDLVKEQLRIAAGERLAWRQGDIQMRGWAMECRIYAEEPSNNFFPSPGVITRLKVPGGPGVRDDSGIYEGWNVPLEYDPLLSKLVVWGSNRGEATARMSRALGEYQVSGIQTNISFFRTVLEHPDFLAGRIDTGLIDRMMVGETVAGGVPLDVNVEAAVMLAVALETQRKGPAWHAPASHSSAWKLAGREALLNNLPVRDRPRPRSA